MNNSVVKGLLISQGKVATSGHLACIGVGLRLCRRSVQPPRMGIYTRVALQTTVIGWAATCDEQTDGHRAIAYTARE